jgi:serine/threonine protein kinase
LIGKTLGNYEITGELGKGGMGEVYRARDTRLNREVAVKVLPEHIAHDPDIQERFSREARTVSSLNHPHICILHDVGEHEGLHYLIMELVDGVTLSEKLRKGPLPIDEVIKYGAQIADALDRAHRAGVIHRDLKPGNVMITKSGAKLMDFGLARATRPVTNQDATVAMSREALTAEGAIVGTFQYMAPEQLEGQEVDQRSDLWALGCVLYEMATGQRAFEGATQASLIGSIMHQQPEPVSMRVELTPPELDRLIGACLAKDRDDRVQSAHDIKLQLRWLADGSMSSASQPPVIPTPRSRSRGPAMALTAILALSIGTVGTWFLKDPTESATATPQRFEIGRWSLPGSSTPVISPDGTYVVFAVNEGVSSVFYRRDLDSFDAVPLAGTEGGLQPFFSPDGRWLGFTTATSVNKVPVDGGVTQVVAEVAGINSGTWGHDGNIYFVPRAGGEGGDIALYRVSENGGPVEVVGRLEENESDVWLPEVLPGSEVILVSTFGPEGSRVIAFRQDGSRETLLRNAFMSVYTRQGQLFYRDDGTGAVMAVPFDPQAVAVTGGSIAMTGSTDLNHCFGVSNTGSLVYIPDLSEQGSGRLSWAYRDGRTETISEVEGDWVQPRLSPDGRRIIVRKVSGKCELWMMDLERGSFSRVVQGDDAHDPLWSPDGRRILFDRADSGELVTMGVIGPRTIEIVASGNTRGTPGWWSGGGNLLAYTVSGEGGLEDIWVRKMDGSSEPEPFLATPRAETSPVVSPDGKLIAYTSDETGVSEIYVRNYPSDGAVWQVSSGGASNALWSRDGSELYFLRITDGTLMSVSVEGSGELEIGVPEVLLEGRVDAGRTSDYDVAPDGTFVTIDSGDARGGSRMQVLMNWPALVRERGGAE